MEGYEVKGEISRAIYGDIILARDKVTQKDVAIKRVDMVSAERRLSKSDKKVKEDPELERRLVRKLSTAGQVPRHIIALKTDFEEDGVLHMVFEYCGKGDLLSRMKS